MLFSSGEVSTFEVIDGAATWWGQGSVPLDPTATWVNVELTRIEETATVRFNETSFSFATQHPAMLGLVINDSDVVFENLVWVTVE